MWIAAEKRDDAGTAAVLGHERPKMRLPDRPRNALRFAHESATAGQTDRFHGRMHLQLALQFIGGANA
jgi:hypothetical protein